MIFRFDPPPPKKKKKSTCQFKSFNTQNMKIGSRLKLERILKSKRPYVLKGRMSLMLAAFILSMALRHFLFI